jgi:hypothetical protein
LIDAGSGRNGVADLLVRLSFEEGFQTVIGIVEAVTPGTGEKRRTSAASIALFDKDNKVLWSAP